MISNLNTLEVLGADIDGESQVDMILQSLSKSFKEFIFNYNMNKNILNWTAVRFIILVKIIN